MNELLKIELRVNISIGLLLIFSMLANLVQAQVDPSTVEILRDEWGVPHVYAQTDAGAAYGLAWAHAEDDFETMQLPLLSAKQMLGLHLGPRGAGVDYVVELLRLDETARAYQEQVSPAFRALVLAYVQSINRFAERYPDRVLVKKAFPVEELDVYKAYGLSLAVISGADETISQLHQGEIEPVLRGVGSNAFALAPAKTVEGQTFLAVNSHQPLEGPVAWYEAHMGSDEGLNVMGGLFPGAPVVLHGTNANLGWAHTVNHPDKIDVYQLEINPQDKNSYKIDGQWQPLQTDKVKLPFKIFGVRFSVKREVLWSEFGPAMRNKKGVFAFHLSTIDEIGALEQWYELNKARDFSTFKTIL